jgi:hypothetical protein
LIVVQKDLAHLLPDAEIHMFYRTVDTDISGVNPHAPSYVNMLPGGAISAREAYKTAKYGTHSHQAGRTFVPFVLDCYGCLAPAALQLLKDIDLNLLNQRVPDMVNPELYMLRQHLRAVLAQLEKQIETEDRTPAG